MPATAWSPMCWVFVTGELSASESTGFLYYPTGSKVNFKITVSLSKRNLRVRCLKKYWLNVLFYCKN